jgi:alanyl-tRNA synthetase
MNVRDVRTKYLEFFRARGHVIIPSASLVPLNDPTTLFTGSGMQPMLPYFLGEPHPEGTRITDSQKSFRAEDIEEVGDNRHTTFFEMLGNWSLGDYFKQDQLTWMFEFLTDEIDLDPQNLYVTVFAGDEKYSMPRDEESVATWKALFATKGIDATDVVLDTEENAAQVGMQGGRIFYYGVRKNWWSRAGVPDKMPTGEPGGPDSEMFYDFGTPHDETFGVHCHPNCDCGRFMEIGNNVFMQYIKSEGGTFADLPKRNVDFGGGLERITAATNHDPDVFKIDVFAEIIDLLETFSGKQYADPLYQRSFRIVADHMRAAVFMLADGVRPSNTAQGYVLRRLIRRASQYAQKIGVQNDRREESMLNRCAVIIIEKYKAAYSELATEEAYQEITKEIWKEEVQFGHVLDNGMKKLEWFLKEELPIDDGGLADANKHLGYGLSAQAVFELVTTQGLPFEMIVEVARERGVEVDQKGFHELMKKHQDLSRAGSEQKFKGGLADHSEATVRLHTTHHILLKALQMVLGEHVKQRGSNITGERLRIDFSHGEKMTDEQKREVERIVNDVIKRHLPMIRSTMPKDEAEHLGAQHEFGAKYPDMVSVYSLGPVGATLEDPHFDQAYSIEFCGGPHVQNTSEIAQVGTFKITKEEAVASGIRRIKAVLA